MIIVIVLISLVLTIVTSIKSSGGEWEDGWAAGFVLSAIVLTGFVIWGFVTLNSVVGERYIDERIEMYQEENDKIQGDVSRIVAEYMDWEKETYDLVKNESPIVLVQLFPELKSSELVGKQIDLYIENNSNIRALREKKINIKLDKFWLYFG